MRIMPVERPTRRAGTVLPMLAVCLVGLFAFTALAVDLGLLAVSRTECQNAADMGALIGCRMLNNNSTNSNSNLSTAVTTAKSAVASNTDMGANYSSTTNISSIQVGQYLYDATSQTFSVSSWTDVTSAQTATPLSGSWTAMKVTMTYTQPTYFMTVLGVTSMPTGATATAVYRPRDTAFVLDMTGSMAYASQFNYSNKSNNPDTLVPRFGHYYSTRSNCIQNTNQTLSTGEALSQNNYCIYTPDGPPIIRDFVFDPANISNPATSAYPITSSTSTLRNAFHRWSPPESGASTINYEGPTYNFSGYNAFDTTNTSGPTPAPDNFIDQFDVSGITYIGDRYPRLDGKIWTTPTSWATNSSGYPYPLQNPTPAWNDATSGAASCDANYLGITNSSPPSAFNSTWTNYRDPSWETYGYDLVMNLYRTLRGNGNTNSPINPSLLSPAATYIRNSTDVNRFKGYSMGPGYWGKTFFIWPPDPRFSASANLTSPNTTYPAFDTSGNAMCDWRLHFFLDGSGNQFNTQTTTINGTSNTNINSVLFNTGTSGMTLSSSTSGYQINYSAVLKWIKSGPQVLPPNLRAGRVLYYSSIPDDVNTSTATGQVLLDKVFWKNYINFVLGYGYSSGAVLYGTSDNWSSGSVSIKSGALATYKFGWESSGKYPYMCYTDSPLRPRLHFWFGPLSMVNFISGIMSGGNWNAGTIHEAQCWQLKVAMNAVISDVQNNHPNDNLGMVMFAASAYNDIRVAQGQNYTGLKNALFYPKSLLTAINGGNVTSEECPYNSSFSSALTGDEIPNASGSTDPDTGLTYAFNLLSPSSKLPSQYGTIKGRMGASKLIILETDGVPNTYRGTTSSTGMVPTKYGYDTYYPTSTYCSGNIGNGNTTVMQAAYTVVQQIVKPMASQGFAQGSSADSGLSLPNAKALVYPIAFGDLFDSSLAPNATFRPTALQFLANVAYYGNTGTSGATTLPSNQIIIGDYPTRIATLQTCFQQIFQSGITVALIQ
jgi:hypothetical protein